MLDETYIERVSSILEVCRDWCRVHQRNLLYLIASSAIPHDNIAVLAAGGEPGYGDWPIEYA